MSSLWVTKKCPFSLCDLLARLLCFEKLALGAEILPYFVLTQNIIVQIQPKVLGEEERLMHYEVCSWDHQGACWALAPVPGLKGQPDWDHSCDVLPFLHSYPGSFFGSTKGLWHTVWLWQLMALIWGMVKVESSGSSMRSRVFPCAFPK